MPKNAEKRHIPGTNPKWNLELPDGYVNSLVAKDGDKSWDNGYNFDERDDSDEETTFENLKDEVKFNPERAKKLKEQS